MQSTSTSNNNLSPYRVKLTSSMTVYTKGTCVPLHGWWMVPMFNELCSKRRGSPARIYDFPLGFTHISTNKMPPPFPPTKNSANAIDFTWVTRA